jgi:hypothetical protein
MYTNSISTNGLNLMDKDYFEGISRHRWEGNIMIHIKENGSKNRFGMKINIIRFSLTDICFVW